MKTPVRTVRIPDDLWTSLRDKAAEDGLDASGAIRLLIDQYVNPSED